MRIEARPLDRSGAASCCALEAERWLAFVGETGEHRLATRALLRAHLDATDNRWMASFAWEGDTLCGLAVGVVETHERGRDVLVITVPSAHHRSHCPGIWTTADIDEEGTIAAVVGALVRVARTEGISRAVIAFCPRDDDRLRAAAARLGARELAAPTDHRIVVDGSTTFARHAAALGRKRAWKLRRDLGRAADVGATIRVERGPSPEMLDRIWPLCRATLTKHGSRLVFNDRNLLAALSRALPDRALTATLCERDGELLGALISVRTDATVQYLYLAHAERPPLHVSSALWASSIRAELDEGARCLILGATGGVQKGRMGARPVELVQYYLVD